MKKNKDLSIQILKFIIVGGIATLIDWIIYYILSKYLNINPLISNIISYSISVIYNFNLSIKWVFDTKNKKTDRLFIEFIILSLIGLIISETLIWLFIDFISLNSLLSKILSTMITMIINFVLRKKVLE